MMFDGIVESISSISLHSHYIYWHLFLQWSTFQAVIASGGNRSFTIFTYQCGMLHLCCHGQSYASIGFSAEPDFFANHNLSLTENVDQIACLNQPHSNWSSVLHQIGRGKRKRPIITSCANRCTCK